MNFLVRSATRSATVARKQFQMSNFSSLSSLLEREIKEEVEINPIEMPEELAELKNQLAENWTIVDGSATGDDGAIIKMYKKDPLQNGSKVFISFHCQDQVQEDEGLLDSLSGEDEELSSPVQFDLEVSKAGKTMKMACTSEDCVALVDGITIVSDDAEEGYRGPIMEDLPEDVKEEFENFVKEECQVDEDVAAFVAMYR